MPAVSRSLSPQKQPSATSPAEGHSVRQAAGGAKNHGGRPERTVPITESVIFDAALALDTAANAVEAALHLCRRTRAHLVADANTHLGRPA